MFGKTMTPNLLASWGSITLHPEPTTYGSIHWLPHPLFFQHYFPARPLLIFKLLQWQIWCINETHLWFHSLSICPSHIYTYNIHTYIKPSSWGTYKEASESSQAQSFITILFKARLQVTLICDCHHDLGIENVLHFAMT